MTLALFELEPERPLCEIPCTHGVISGTDVRRIGRFQPGPPRYRVTGSDTNYPTREAARAALCLTRNGGHCSRHPEGNTP